MAWKLLLFGSMRSTQVLSCLCLFLYVVTSAASEQGASLRDHRNQRAAIDRCLEALSYENSQTRIKIRQWMRLAYGYANDGLMEKSNQMLQKIFELDPDHPKANFLAAINLARLSDMRRSIFYMERAAAHPSARVEAFLFLVEDYLNLSLYKEASSALERMRTRFPDEPALLLAEASLLEFEERWLEALEKLIHIVDDPNSRKKALKIKFRIFWQLNRFKEVEEIVKQLIQLPSGHKIGLLYKAQLQMQIGRFDEALATLDRNEEVSWSESALLLKVLIFLRKGMTSKAQEVAKDLRFPRSQLSSELEISLAKRNFEKVILIVDKSFYPSETMYFYKARALVEMGRNREAYEYLSQQIQYSVSRGRPLRHKLLAVLFATMKDNSKLKTDLGRALVASGQCTDVQLQKALEAAKSFNWKTETQNAAFSEFGTVNSFWSGQYDRPVNRQALGVMLNQDYDEGER